MMRTIHTIADGVNDTHRVEPVLLTVHKPVIWKAGMPRPGSSPRHKSPHRGCDYGFTGDFIQAERDAPTPDFLQHQQALPTDGDMGWQ
jgi:hypothetical protein